MDEIDEMWDAADSVEGASQIEKRIIEIRVLLDQLESQAKIPEIVEQIEMRLEQIGKCMSEMNSAQKSAYEDLKERLPALTAKKRYDALENFKEEVLDLWRATFADRFDFWAGNLAYLYKTRDRLPNTSEVNRLFDQGARALDMRDKEGVRRCVFRLWDLSPEDVVEAAKRGYGSTLDNQG